MAMLVVAVAGVIPSASEHWTLWEIPYSRALHYENLFWMLRGVQLRSQVDENRKQRRALDIVRSS